ncbi:PIG-L family deacetylase [Cyanobium sp. ATX 6A2]|uniref:PIG-L family deacetylase n=1 Tax=Cyanobium sp. ATX 6A2 TaxID=2823700 RepID=UPI0020CB9604|nr:PIG-L family deacetylase [Cyanobium sp. ATX 6A2]MCP9889419.1 PIG-L family deacetylase [Cyanobium sp. ATX 6A2]
MLIAAHPDDEIVGAGMAMASLPGLKVVHATNGVPTDPRYAGWAGFDTLEAYERAREAEARKALDLLGLPQTSLIRLGFVDQQLSRRLLPLTRRLAGLIREHRPDLVITHPYEAGHPDHDAVSFACHHALWLLEQTREPVPALVEMTSYFSRDGERVVGEFAQGNEGAMTMLLNQADQDRKTALYGCFESQIGLLSTFKLEAERFRQAPRYDFKQLPEVPEILYDRYELGTTSAQWLELSCAATATLAEEISRNQVWQWERPPVGQVNFGDLARIEPISWAFGYDRGTPIDRPFIEAFLDQHRQDIRGRVLEIGDDSYTRQFGDDRVTRRDVLHVKEGAPGATIIGDLSHAPQIPDSSFDCLILTQVLVVIFDLPATIATIHRILRPGGVALITVPGISNVDFGEWRDNWMWCFTTNSLRKLLLLHFPEHGVEVSSRGNLFTSIAFLQGLSAEDLQGFPAGGDDPHYPQTVLGRAVK